MAIQLLGEGLIIRRAGVTLEFQVRIGDRLQFKNPLSGEFEVVTEQAFYDELRTRKIVTVDAFSSPDKLTYPEEAESTDELRTSLALPDNYQIDLDSKMHYVEAALRKGISRGQLRLLDELTKEVHAELLAQSEKSKGVTAAVVARKSCPSAFTVSRWMRQFETQRAEAYVLVSGHFQRGQLARFSEDDMALVAESIKVHYCIDTKPTCADAYRNYEELVKKTNLDRTQKKLSVLKEVSIKTYIRAILKLPAEDVAIARLGRQEARKKFRMQKGHMPGQYALDHVEIDHGQIDLFVVDDRTCMPLGKPWITVIADRLSGVVLGFYISFHGACLESIYGCLRHTLWPHHRVREIWPEIENDWLSFGHGHCYVSDRGRDFLSRRYRLAIRTIGGFVEYCESRTPWHKPSIERFMRTISSALFESMPGKAFSSWSLRGDYNPLTDAVVRFSTLVFLIHKWVADDHNVSVKGSKLARRIDIFQESLKLAPPYLPNPPALLDVTLGNWYSGSLRHDGIRYKYLQYANSERLRDVLRQQGEGKRVNYVVHSGNLGSVHVQDPRNGGLFEVPALRQDYAEGLTLWQHEYLRKEAGDELKAATAVDRLMSIQQAIKSRVQDDLAARETATKVQYARIAHINSNDVIAGNMRSTLDLHESPELPQRAAAPVIIVPPIVETPSFTELPPLKWGI